MLLRPLTIASLTAVLASPGLLPMLASEEDASPPSSSAQGETGKMVLDNESVWHLARQQAYAVTAAKAALDATKADRGDAMSPFRPQVNAGLSWRRYGDRPVGPGGMTGDRHSYQGQITLEQSLLTFGRRYHVHRITRNLIEGAHIELLGAERDAALRALAALESYRFAVATRTVAQQRVEQRQGELSDAEKLFEVGNVRMLDVRQSRINLSAAQDNLVFTEAEVASARSDLLSALALEQHQAVSIDDALTRPGNLEAAISHARSRIEDNIDLRGLEQSRRILRQQANLELTQAKPSLSGVLGYGYGGDRLNDMRDEWYVGINAQWRLLDGGGRYARRSSLLANERRVGIQQDALINERQRELAVIQAESAALAARIELQESVVADTEQNYEDARVLYQTGEITLTRVGEAGLAVSEAQFNLNRYRFEESVLAHRLRALSE
ncbi:MAG: TolC family protein [Planctomycetota bacterium]|nr:MAG: TolC family protein [Planctomycetota bacterium]